MEKLKELRLQHKLSQQKLADYLGISQQSIYKYENALAEPDIQTLIQLSDYFQTTIDYLVGHTPQTTSIDLTSLNANELHHLKLYKNLSAEMQQHFDAILEASEPAGE